MLPARAPLTSTTQAILVQSSLGAERGYPSALPGAGVAAALDAQMVAKMRPHLLGPRRVRRLLPLSRAHNLRCCQMVKGDVALRAADAAVAAGAQGARHRAQSR